METGDDMVNVLNFNGLCIYRNMVDNPAELLQSITDAERESSMMRWQKAKVVEMDGIKENEIRTNYVLPIYSHDKLPGNLDEGTKTLTEIYLRVHGIFMTGLMDFMARFQLALKEQWDQGYQILKYMNGAEYQQHMDDGVKTPRRASGIFYLNKDFEGGELEFPFLNFTYQPYPGDLLIFPAGVPFSHAAKPVTSGEKYSIVSWWF